MTAAAVALAAVLAVAAVLWVAWPLLVRDRSDEAGEATDEAARERLRLLEARDRALAALKELEFDHRTGKISDEDYAALVRSLRQEASAALAALDAAPPGDALPAAPHRAGTTRAAPSEPESAPASRDREEQTR